MRVWLGGHLLEAKRVIESSLSQTSRPATGPIDVAIITPDTTDEAGYFADKLRPRLVPGATLWVLFPANLPENESPQNFIRVMDRSGFVEKGKVSIRESYIAFGFILKPSETKSSAS